ncbi:MAG: efflux RND transporter periplasmic adaptor subunit [Marinilabiliaceae bacterium]|nr:efflux RND transporter periplasmic adaptor subunit [Marinilabiliaceae bacterium]
MMILKYIPLLLIVLLSTSCGQAPAHDEHGHGHDEVKLPLTAYSNQLEVFAEADPFIVGHTSNVLAHFSVLDGFKPMEATSVTLSLVVGTKGIRQTVNQAVRSGIYAFKLQPGTAGKGQLIFDIQKNGQQQQVVVRDIQVYADEHDAIHEAEEAMPASSNAISFTKEQSWKVDFATDAPQVGNFGSVIKATASVQPSPANETIIVAKSSGIVNFSNGMLTEGKAVTAGSPLLTVVGEGLVENTEVKRRQAKAEFERTQSEWIRKQKLAKQQIVSQKELQQAKADHEKAAAEWKNLKNTLNQSGEVVSAASNGFVHQVHVRNGAFVEAGTSLLTITQTDRLLLKAMVRQSKLQEIATIESANIVTSIGNQTHSLKDLNGRILSYGRATNSDSYLIPVNIEVDYTADLAAGGFVDVFMKSAAKEAVLSVPQSALVEEQGNFFVFVQLTPELFEKRVVKTGARDGMRTVVTAGLKSQERIVTRGALLVKLAAVSSSIDPHAGHVH